VLLAFASGSGTAAGSIPVAYRQIFETTLLLYSAYSIELCTYLELAALHGYLRVHKSSGSLTYDVAIFYVFLVGKFADLEAGD
jgi:hypothetical protein